MTVVISLNAATRRRLNLYVAGETLATFRARAQCRALQDAVTGIEIEEIDVLTQPAFAEAASVLAGPTLSDDSISPPRRIVGDLGEVERVLQFLGIERASA